MQEHNTLYLMMSYDLSFTEEAMIIYISRGLLSSLTEAREVMDMIAYNNGRLNNRVVINTYAVIDSKLRMSGYHACSYKKSVSNMPCQVQPR